MPVWKIFKHLISRLLVMRYGSVNTTYDKDIQIPEEIKKDLLLSLVKNDIIK